MAMLENFETKNKKAIKNLNVINDKLFKMNKHLRYILCGPSGSGKSYLIKNFVLNRKWGYKYFFDEIYLFIKSLDDQLEWKDILNEQMMSNKTKIIDEFEPDDIKNLFYDIELDVNNNKNPPNVLFIFDDMALDGLTFPNKKTVIDELFIRGRHANISIIISTQVYKSINRNTRVLNCNALTIFEGTKHSDLEAIAEEHSTRYDKEKVLNLFKNNLIKKHDFITIDYTHDEVLFKDKNFSPLGM
jgi:AAA+ ATPase superfamily predicted ATPase